MSYPAVPDAKLDGWDERSREEATVFGIPGVSVIGHTVLYDDPDLREALDRAGYGDLLDRTASDGRMVATDEGGYWRFFFATALSFRPPLAPGIGPTSIRPTVIAEARRSFQRDLEARGFEDVDRGGNQRFRATAGTRSNLVKYTASYPLENHRIDAIDVEGWLAVWADGGTFRIAGGAYPVRGLDELLADLDPDERPETDPNAYREELLELIRATT